MKPLSILLFSLVLAAPAVAEVSTEEELRVIDVTANYLVDHPYPYYRHHWKVIVAADSRLRFTPRFVPDVSKAPRAEAFSEAVADLTTRNGAAIHLDKAPEGLGFADVVKYEAAAGYDWETLLEEHVDLDAIVEMSRPGFDASGMFAIVVSHTANASGGNSGIICELVKDASGNWSVVGTLGSPGIRKGADGGK